MTRTGNASHQSPHSGLEDGTHRVLPTSIHS
jgi:hypothetical protein